MLEKGAPGRIHLQNMGVAEPFSYMFVMCVTDHMDSTERFC